MDYRKYLAEVIGAFVLVLIGTMGIVAAVSSPAPALVVVPLAFGLGLLAAIAIGGHVSGGHYNPAVTLAALLDRRIAPVDAAFYVAAQVIGALIAAGVLFFITDQATVAGTTTHPGIGVEMIGAMTVEIVLTAIFVAVILMITKRAANHAVFAIPLTLAAVHFAGIPFSGASVNPARSLGPALVGGNLDDIIIYLTAPFIGAALGWLVYKLLDEEPQVELVGPESPE